MRPAARLLDDGALVQALATLDVPAPACRASRRAIVQMLDEVSPLYAGRGTGEVERLRAFLLVRLAEHGFADECLPYAVEELETGATVFGQAAAARALRSASAPPPHALRAIEAAMLRVALSNEHVDFTAFPAAPDARSQTAMDELEATRTSILAAAPSPPIPRDCCGDNTPANDANNGFEAVSPAILHRINATRLENQERETTSFGALTAGRACLIAFFYTRCMNPNRCSATVSRLAAVDRLLRERPAASPYLVAGLTYDPGYDSAERLARYGRDREMLFSPSCQLLRTVGAFAPIVDALELGVGYGAANVNRHRLELLLIDAGGHRARRLTRRTWTPHEIAEALMPEDAALPVN